MFKTSFKTLKVIVPGEPINEEAWHWYNDRSKNAQ
jgi:acyl-coenzyme A synthetase/AMP-(fatty) acid ligase